jgi:hypothetical protein
VLRRSLTALVAALLVFLTAACGAEGSPPEVTFAAGQASVVAGPTQFCDIDLTDCTSDPAAPVELAVPPGTPLLVDVPEPVSETPWHIVFTYRDEAEQQVNGRSPLFAAGERGEFTLELPAPNDQLLEAQVQQFGPAPVLNQESGTLEFPTRSSWVLRTRAA